MPVLLSSFAGWQKIKEVTVTGAATDHIEITGLGLETGDTCMFVISIYNYSGSTVHYSMYFGADTGAGNYYTYTVKPVVNVMTGSNANNAVFLTLNNDVTAMTVGFFAQDAVNIPKFLGQSMLDIGATLTVQEVALNYDGSNDYVVSILLQADDGAGFNVGSRFELYKKV